MARLYSDEDFPLPAVIVLRELGHDVVTIQERGHDNEGTKDNAVLAFATAENRAVITLNRRDYRRLHRANSTHGGIVICRSDTDHAGLAQRIDAAVKNVPELHGRLVRVNRPVRNKAAPRS